MTRRVIKSVDTGLHGKMEMVKDSHEILSKERTTRHWGRTHPFSYGQENPANKGIVKDYHQILNVKAANSN